MLRALLCSFVLLVAPVQAAEFSGNYLLQVCATDQKGKELAPGSHVACQAYIAGIIDYHKLSRSMGTAPGVDFCVPDDVDLYEVQAKVFLHLAKNKEQQGPFIAAPAVALALYNSYPCKN